MTEYIALIRGINVGRAKRIAMAELRELVENLGYSKARTLLNSGNVVFQGDQPDTNKLSREIQAGIESRFGIIAQVVVITAAELAVIIRENPLAPSDASKLLVAFVTDPTVLTKAELLAHEEWSQDQFSIGSMAAYIWCANGILESKLMQAFTRLAGESATTRNWSTVLKLGQLCGIESYQT